MPLAFNSQSHGTVAFGFFHIETQLLLLQEIFFWAQDFCAMAQSLARAPKEQVFSDHMAGFGVRGRENLGDLHGAIGGHELGGFIGALYSKEPFPRSQDAFRQKTQGRLSAREVSQRALEYGSPEDIPVSADPQTSRFSIGGYGFNRAGLWELVTYVWRGGMPGWEGGKRPDYVLAMAQQLKEHASPWFEGLLLYENDVGYDY